MHPYVHSSTIHNSQDMGTSQAVQRLRLRASTAGGTGSIPGWGTKIPHAVLCGQKKKITKTWKQSKCPLIYEWIKKMWYIYTMEYYSAINKNEIMPFAAGRMDLEMIILSEVSQKQKDKYHMISLTCGI